MPINMSAARVFFLVVEALKTHFEFSAFYCDSDVQMVCI